MGFQTDPGETLLARVRPSRLIRWRRYLPAAALALAGALVVAARGPVLGPLTSLGLTTYGALLVLGALAVAAAVGASGLVGRPPVVTLVVGSFALSLGAQLAEGPWLGLPLLLVAAAWTGWIELQRLLNGLAMTDRRVLLPRPFREALGIAFDDIHVVHTTERTRGRGSLILETEHGTLAAPDLPGVVALGERVEARMDRVPVNAELASLEAARERIEAALRGAPRRRVPAPRAAGGGPGST